MVENNHLFSLISNLYKRIKMLTLSLLAGLTSSVYGANWNYATNNGADWPSLVINGTKNECGGTHQSPIDLPWDVPREMIIEAKTDRFNRIYTNQETNIKIEWNGHTSQTAVNKPG